MHTNLRFYCDVERIEVVWMTPPCCLPTCFPFFLPPVFTTHSSSSSIYTIYESSDPKGEMLHSVDYFHLVFPWEAFFNPPPLLIYFTFWAFCPPLTWTWEFNSSLCGCDVYESFVVWWRGRIWTLDRFTVTSALVTVRAAHFTSSTLFWKHSDL